MTGAVIFGATGSGKTSGAAKHLALGYLAAGFGGLVLCAKAEECRQWEEWARLTGRTDDVVVFRPGAPYSFNFLNHENERSGAGAGLAINIVALLDEAANALTGGAGSGEGGGDNKFFEDSHHHLAMNLVMLALLARIPVTLKLLRSIVATAAQTVKEAQDPQWLTNSICAAALSEADRRTGDASPAERDDFEETLSYWRSVFPALSGNTLRQ